ncbi:hypothetical protein AVEN_143763-1 [Araneus ventricosus]|uniref:Uncharacterized protein n=1 Tax=Araneus ventricosus TaxID=182803 RepID=A0A4Y2APS4_ARAVE|nr:hypothetical protein AVEN_143763-1 [Araneus ventricosus]
MTDVPRTVTAATEGLAMRSSSESVGVFEMSALRCPHKKKSMLDKSGERASQQMVHRGPNVALRKLCTLMQILAGARRAETTWHFERQPEHYQTILVILIPERCDTSCR